MIYSSILCNVEVPQYPKAVQTALAFLKDNDFTTMEPGRYQIQGDDIFAMVVDTKTEPVSAKRPETHEDFLDVQFLAQGKECIGVALNTGGYTIAEAKPDQDVYFYDTVENEVFMEMRPGTFCVLYPHDIHRPGVLSGEAMDVRKVVVKIRISAM